jgi:hypothetical protein
VDIYDIPSQTWSTAELSQARYGIAVASAGNKIVFAGGETATGTTTRVDIYDVAANSWSTAELNEARANVAATSSGNKMFFAGGAGGGGIYPWRPYSGTASNRVEIYDALLNTWSTATLSEASGGIVASAAGTKIVFASGWSQSDKVDIYDTATHAWSTASLSQTKRITATTSVGDTIFFVRSVGGGNLSSSSYSEQLDVYDVSSGNWSVDSLTTFDFLDSFFPHEFVGAVTVGHSAVFIPETLHHFIIYNSDTNTWLASSEFATFFGWETSVVPANNQVYLANWDGVWRVQF